CLTPPPSATDPPSLHDALPISYGLMLHHALAAAETLAAEGLSVNIVDIRSLRPLDVEIILREARKTGKCLVVYEDNRMFGAGAEDRKSTRLNSSHQIISYAVFC